MPRPFPHLEPSRRGQLHHLTVYADCLKDNPWGDPWQRDLLVYTPHGYQASAERLPAVMLLAGFAGTGEGLLARGLSDIPITTRIDHLIAAGCPPFLAVLPDVMTTLGGSQFVDSPAVGAYLTYLSDHVMPEVDARFRTSGRWGVAGRSSGALGAFNLALHAPDRVRAIAFHAGDAGFDLCYLEDLSKAIRGIRAAGGLEGFHAWFWAQERPNADAFAAFNILAMAAAYRPALERRPFPAHLPFDPVTGEIDFDEFRTWRAFDPVLRAAEPQNAAILRALDLCFVDAGLHDEYHLQLGARRFVAVLRDAGVQVEHEEFPGGHRGTAWRYDVSLPRLAAALTP